MSNAFYTEPASTTSTNVSFYPPPFTNQRQHDHADEEAQGLALLFEPESSQAIIPPSSAPPDTALMPEPPRDPILLAAYHLALARAGGHCDDARILCMFVAEPVPATGIAIPPHGVQEGLTTIVVIDGRASVRCYYADVRDLPEGRPLNMADFMCVAPILLPVPQADALEAAATYCIRASGGTLLEGAHYYAPRWLAECARLV